MNRPPSERGAPPAIRAGVDFGAPEFRVLIFAPVGRTAELARDALARAGLAAAVCATLDELCGALRGGAGAALLDRAALPI